MRDRPRIQRALLRRSLRKQLRAAEEEKAEMLQLVLDDDAVFETVYETSMTQATAYGESTGVFSISLNDGQPVVDNLLKLLQWFITNGPMLMQIIEQIIGLFGSVGVAKELFENEELFV